MKIWAVRLDSSRGLTTLKETRQELNKMTGDGFKWQPYEKPEKKCRHNVSKDDRDLFASSTVLAFYWVVERHNVGGVMKQFGLVQEVLPLFTMPFARVEKVGRILNNYNASGKVPSYALWDSRYGCVLKGNKFSSSVYTDESMTWYRANTIMYIGRGHKSEEMNITKTKCNEHEA